MSEWAWALRGAIRVAVPVAEPLVEQRPDSWMRELIACPTCRARLHEPCVTATGVRRAEHASRIVSQRCRCGDVRPRYGKLCARCAPAQRRATTAKASRALRARRKVAA